MCTPKSYQTLLITTLFSISFRFFILSLSSLKFLCEPHFILKGKSNRHWTNLAACYYRILQKKLPSGSLWRISICSFAVYPVPLSKLVLRSYYCADSLVGSDFEGAFVRQGFHRKLILWCLLSKVGKKDIVSLYVYLSFCLSVGLFVCMSIHIAVLVISVSTHCHTILLCHVGINLSYSVFKLVLVSFLYVCMSSYFFFCEMWN